MLYIYIYIIVVWLFGSIYMCSDYKRGFKRKKRDVGCAYDSPMCVYVDLVTDGKLIHMRKVRLSGHAQMFRHHDSKAHCIYNLIYMWKKTCR